jgi:ABC-type multidrug transport system ATPase subunit
VDGLTALVRPGRVTGFLGQNGAGKSTTMRLILGLDRADRGEILVAGRRYAGRRAPLREIGAVLEGRPFHPGRTVRDHLRWLAASNDIAGHRSVRSSTESDSAQWQDSEQGSFPWACRSGSELPPPCSAIRPS